MTVVHHRVTSTTGSGATHGLANRYRHGPPDGSSPHPYQRAVAGYTLNDVPPVERGEGTARVTMLLTIVRA